MAYEKQEWLDYPDETTPINAQRLNYMEEGIYQNSEDIDGLTTENITNFEISEPSDGQFLVYNAETEKWVNKSVANAEEGSY